ncbi:uracil-DNA glycosylase family protein [Halolamina salifodinae]|uniref:Uracil-DNA glycosylase n=1 Tax=Halolamina salifodinae TaxID=1202767 RepID=A0A8T4H073_9EURY|nr:uracil-DNA glycosylase family protein [Halolamina salifodinae]MBP1986748.1 uracil-DNA glycosylase [Halolamina salifodinae]
MQHVTDRVSNPFGMTPPYGRFVPGYGDANADFHVVGDHPGVHGGAETGVPFTGTDAAERLQRALRDAGLLQTVGDDPEVDRTFLSYLNMCVAEDRRSDADYVEMERFFDAELRAIAAHVLLPVGERATRHVLETYTAQAYRTEIDMDQLHGEELLGSGWLVLPIKDPAEWDTDDDERLVESLLELQSTDFRRETDLGRFTPGGESYHVR